MSEQRPQYLTDAAEMLGTGYNHSPLEIHPPTTVIRRRGFEMVEEVVPAFVKISTSFKQELKDIDGIALKVWLYIALSINRNTEEAFPGIRTIAAACGASNATIIQAIKHLEAVGLLTVTRANRKSNLYRIPDYVSANSKTVSNIDTDCETVSDDGETVSENPQTVSKNQQTVLDSAAFEKRNQINQSNQNNQTKKTSKTSIKGIEAAIFEGREVTDEDIHLSRGGEIEATLLRLDEGLRINCPRTPEWQSLARWINKAGNLDGWLRWFMGDEFRAKTVSYLTPNKIKMTWPQAIREQPKPRDPYAKLIEYLDEQEAVNA